MQLVPAEGGLSDQVLVIQLIELAAGFAQAGAVQRGGSIGVEAGARDQAEPAEQPLLAWTEIGVGQVEGGRDRQILRPHQFRPVCRRREAGHHAAGGLRRVVAQLAGDQPDRQRQVPAPPGDLAHRRIGGVDPGPARQPGQQRSGLLRSKRVEADDRGVVQRGQPPAAGHQHQAAPGTWQQRPDLLMAGRVIQQQQDLLAGHVITPPRGPGFQPRRDLRRGNPRGQQQAGQRIRRVHRPLAPGMAVQRQVKLAVGETASQPVGRMDREGGLADPGHPADRADPHHPTARGQAL